MPNKVNLSKLLIIPIFAVIFLGQTTQVHAGWFLGLDFGGRWHRGGVAVSLPRNFVTIGVGRHRYYYANGIYYQGTPDNYVIVPAPVGAVVYAVPAGYRQIIVNGVTYYEYNGTYYILTTGGYQVVQPPIIVQPTVVATMPTVSTNVARGTPEDVTINIPNSQGGYTAVTLKRSGNGFVGPQGEFYAEFPSVEQLRVMYAK